MSIERVRKNIRVLESRDEAGVILPVQVFYGDKKFDVDKVLDIQNRAATKAGGFGLRYTVSLTREEDQIYSQNAYLFLEVGADPEVWFVEAKTT